MYYYLKENDGIQSLVSSTKLPKNMDGVVLITREEYLAEQARLEAEAVVEEAEAATEEDYLAALAELGVSE